MTFLELSLARFKDKGEDDNFVAIIPAQFLEDKYFNFLYFYTEYEKIDKEKLRERLIGGRNIPGNVAVLTQAKDIIFVKKEDLEEVTCDNILTNYRRRFTAENLPLEIDVPTVKKYFFHNSFVMCKAKAELIATVFQFVADFLADIHDYKEVGVYKESGGVPQELYYNISNYLDIFAVAVSWIMIYRRMWIDGYNTYEKNPLNLNIQQILLQIHRIVMSDPRVCFPNDKLNNYKNIFRFPETDIEVQELANEIHKRNLTLAETKKFIEFASLGPPIWDKIITECYHIPYLYDYPYIAFDFYFVKIYENPKLAESWKLFEKLYIPEDDRGIALETNRSNGTKNIANELELADFITQLGILRKSYYHRQLIFNLSYFLWLNPPLNEKSTTLYKRMVVALPKQAAVSYGNRRVDVAANIEIGPQQLERNSLQWIRCFTSLEDEGIANIEYELIQKSSWDHDLTKKHFLSILSSQSNGLCHRMIEFFRCDPENVKIFLEIIEKGTQEQALYHSGICWGIVVNTARWCPKVIPPEYRERIHSVLFRSFNSLMSLGQVKTSIMKYAECLNNEDYTGFQSALQSRLQSRIDAEVLIDAYFEKKEEWTNYLQEERLQRCLKEFYYVFFLKFSEKHTYYSTNGHLENKLKDIVVRLREALHFYPHLRKSAFHNKDFKKIFRNVLERGGNIRLSEELTKLLDYTWAEFHASELVGKPLLGQFNVEDLQLKVINSGGQATVYVADAPTLFCQTIGKIFTTDSAYEEISGELELLMRTQSHPHVVHIYGYILKNNQHVGILMEYCKGGTVFDVIKNESKNYDEATILKWSAESASGLMFLHDNGITHRDVKPANMLLTKNGVLKISDLGISKLKPIPMQKKAGDVLITNTLCHGTPGYRAPEIEAKQPYTNVVDVYSLGKSIRHMIDRKFPGYYVEKGKELTPVVVSDPLINLCNRMINKYPAERPSMKAVFNELQSLRGVTTSRVEKQIADFDLD